MGGTGTRPTEHTEYHKDGTVRGIGQMLNGVPTGYWEWFRKDGSKMRSGTFDGVGDQIGEWITYDRAGNPYKVTDMNRKRKKSDSGE